MSFLPPASPLRSSPPSTDPSTLHSTHSTQYTPQTPSSRFVSESLTSSSLSSETTHPNVIWQTLTFIRNWFIEKFNAIISWGCCRSHSQNIEESGMNTPSSSHSNLPKNIQQLIAPLKSWLADPHCSQPAVDFDRMRIEETPIDSEELLNTGHENHQAVLNRLKNCTEPTYFTIEHYLRPNTSLIIIPIEVKKDSDLGYHPDYIQFDNDLSTPGEWICFNSQGNRLTLISATASIDSPWLKTLLQTRSATDEDNDVMYRLKR